jgi:predicted hotdog family 3-hydroxylacyl-ACP dehydratase
MSQAILDRSVDTNDNNVSATVSVQGNGSQRVTVSGTSATAEQFIQLAAQALNVEVTLRSASIVANGHRATADTELTGEENVVAIAPKHANG